MMNFYCTIKFEELSLPTFFQGKKNGLRQFFMVR